MDSANTPHPTSCRASIASNLRAVPPRIGCEHPVPLQRFADDLLQLWRRIRAEARQRGWSSIQDRVKKSRHLYSHETEVHRQSFRTAHSQMKANRCGHQALVRAPVPATCMRSFLVSSLGPWSVQGVSLKRPRRVRVDEKLSPTQSREAWHCPARL